MTNDQPSLQPHAEQAHAVRELYRQLEHTTTGKEWNLNDLTIGMIGDIGELCQLIGAYQGIRPNPNPNLTIEEQLGHELSDILWSVFVIAKELDINLDTAYPHTMKTLTQKITNRLNPQPATHTPDRVTPPKQ